MTPERRAVLDLGTNSTRFLLAEPESGTRFRPSDVVDRDAVVTRLGEGVDAEGRLGEDAIERVLDRVREYDRRIREAGGAWVGGVATSACRRASNRESFLDRVETVARGVRPELISGEREAELTCSGVRASFPAVEAGRVVDIGGGSTEVIAWDREGIRGARSLRIGVVTLRERCVDASEWTPAIDECVRALIEEALGDGRLQGDGPLVVVGGTGTTLSAVRHELREYDSTVVHGDRVPDEELDRLLRRFQSMPFERIARHPMVQPGREDVLIPGLHILRACLRRTDRDEVLVSDFGILVGCLLEAINR